MLFSILVSTIPLLLFVMLFMLFYHQKREDQSLHQTTYAEPDIENLENNLKKLIENNKLAMDTYNLQQNLKNSPTNIIASYLREDKKDLKGFHLFQLIFSLIRNKTDDAKIIKILRHYLPSSSTASLYALLRSCKEFLRISFYDNKQKELLKDINQNRLRTTLVYLQQKLNEIFNQIPSSSPEQQKKLIEVAVIDGLIFASFCRFYNQKYSQKILQLANTLSPEIFSYWHSSKKDNFSKNIIPSVKPKFILNNHPPRTF